MTEQFVRDMFTAIDSRDWEALGRHFHPDLVYERPGFPLLVGRDGVVEFYKTVRAIHGEHRIEVVVVDDRHGATWGRFVGSKKDGTPVDVQFADCYTWRDGLLGHRKSHFFLPYV
jgi:ketosteroid isomerase-like protein